MQLGMPGDASCLFRGLCTSISFEILNGDLATLIVEPKVMTTARELRAYPIAKRQCYFSDERQLMYFDRYTQSNCETECEINDILEQCGCLLIFIES